MHLMQCHGTHSKQHNRWSQKINKFDHVTLVLSKLHWCLLKRGYSSKLFSWPTRLHRIASQYVTDLITPYQPSHHLHSSDQHLFVVPGSRLKSYSYKCFSITAPKEWNMLPFEIRISPSLEIVKKNLN